jgi:TolB-like protein/tetratricopeptide (TPR) repeat protein
MAEGEEGTGISGGTTTRTVFVSYASQDTEIANTVCRELESRGIRCWIAPRDVAPGALYADAIVRAINEAKVLLIVLSQSAVASAHVGREVERAASKHKQIIALRIDAAPLSPALEYFLSESQWIDVAALGMPGALVKLKEAVGQESTMASSANPGASVGARNPVGLTGRRAFGVPTRVAIAAMSFLGAAVAVGILIHFWPLKHGDAQAPAAAISDKSIAVLPFADMSQKKDQEYFGDGMAEEILDLLAKIPGLTVIGRTSSFQFKGKNEDLRTIGTKLNAAYVLEGSVRNSGDQIRITAQLINTETGAHEWSETYDRPIGDVLKLQDAIAAAVVRELQLTVSAKHLKLRDTLKNAEVYDLMLRGRHAADRWDAEGLDEAITLFHQARDQEPRSSDASAELAFTYYKQGVQGFRAATEVFEQARRAAVAALRFDETSELAHYVLGNTHVIYDWDWAAAEHEFQQVEMLAPGSAGAPSGEARLSLTLGHWSDAVRQIKAALALDPLDPDSLWMLMEIQLHRGNLAEAEAAQRRLLDVHPTFAYGHNYLGLVLLARGDQDAALREMQRETTADGMLQGLAMAHYALGNMALSDSALGRLTKEFGDRYAFEIAEVYAFRSRPDEGMQWLERAYAQKDAILYYVKGDWPLRNLEADPRFKAFLKKMNLPE